MEAPSTGQECEFFVRKRYPRTTETRKCHKRATRTVAFVKPCNDRIAGVTFRINQIAYMCGTCANRAQRWRMVEELARA